jgi:hypothetical protein
LQLAVAMAPTRGPIWAGSHLKEQPMYEVSPAPRAIERERGQSLPVATRWELYRKQQGRDWSDYLTRDEYDRYLGEFTYIREQLPHQYQAALQARNDFEKVKGLAPLYQRLNIAANEASLSLDRQGNLFLTVQRDSFVKVLSDAGAKAIIDHVGGKLSTWILGANVLGPLGLILDLAQLYRSIQNEKLVGAVGREADKARFRKKLSLIMDIMAADMAKQSRGNPAKVKIALYDLYHQYQAAWYRYQDFLELNRSLDPNRPRWRQAPTMGPAPAGALRR